MNGNGCVTAVVTEMLVQSQDGAIDFYLLFLQYFLQVK
jgi:hypothetical protein